MSIDKAKPNVQKARGLGRGLSALLGQDADDQQHSSADTAETSTHAAQPVVPAVPQPGMVIELRLDQIEANPYQPRTHFDETALEELADSIREHGIVQPLTVRRLANDAYQLIAGERRLTASRKLGLETVPAYIRTANDEQMLEMALIENIQRQDLNAIEVALAYKRLIDELGITLEAVGGKVGKQRATVNNYLRLLKLPPDIQLGLKEGRISMGHARALITVDDPFTQLSLYRDILEQGQSVRQVEEAVANIGRPKPGKPEKPGLEPAYELNLRQVRRSLENRFQTKIDIKADPEGKGEIRLKFFNTEDLNRLLELLQ